MTDNAPVIVSVDADVCAASAVCVAIASDVFELPVSGTVAWVKVATLADPAQVERARAAAAACPTGAITVV
jgi:ferredoxin